MGYKVAVVGATGNVGREVLLIMEERRFPADEVVALASERSVGKEVSYGEERTLKGSYMGSCVPRRDIPRYLELYRTGKLPVDRLLSARITLDDINLAMDRLADGKAIRQIVEF